MRSRVLVASFVLWVGSWYVVYKEIFHWRHMTKTLRFQAPPSPPGMPPMRPGIPVRTLRVVAFLAPAVFVAALAGRPPRSPGE